MVATGALGATARLHTGSDSIGSAPSTLCKGTSQERPSSPRTCSGVRTCPTTVREHRQCCWPRHTLQCRSTATPPVHPPQDTRLIDTTPPPPPRLSELSPSPPRPVVHGTATLRQGRPTTRPTCCHSRYATTAASAALKSTDGSLDDTHRHVTTLVLRMTTARGPSPAPATGGSTTVKAIAICTITGWPSSSPEASPDGIGSRGSNNAQQ